MILTTNNDCTIITLTSEEGIINDIIAPEITDCCVTLELGANCCEPTTSISLPLLYNFSYDVTSCTVDTQVNPSVISMTIAIAGIDPECVSLLTYPETYNIVTTDDDPADLSFVYSFSSLPISGDIEFEVGITTCNDLTYILTFTINATGGCGGLVQGALVTTYPLDIPGVTITGLNTMDITPEALGLTSTSFPDGVYYVGLTQNNTTEILSESDTILVNCETTCRIIDVLANDLCSDIYLLWDALQYSFNCDTITYEQQCDLWFAIGKQLGYFLDTPCITPSTSCGTCNK